MTNLCAPYRCFCCYVPQEEWESEATFAAHLEAPHVHAFWESADEIYDRPEEIHTYYGPEF